METERGSVVINNKDALDWDSWEDNDDDDDDVD